jgi:hypothetical protein
MFSLFKKKKSPNGLYSLVADELAVKYEEERFLAKFRATKSNDWNDFEDSGYSHKDFSVGLFFIFGLKIYRAISSDDNALSVIDKNQSEKLFLECVCFGCFSISKLDDEGCLTDLYGRAGSFCKLEGSDVVLSELIDLYSDIQELSPIHPQEIVDFWEDRVEYYYQLRVQTTDNFFKALCYLFTLAVRSYNDMPKNNVLDIDLHDIALLTPPSPSAGIALQDAAEQSLLEIIDIAKRTMYGYREQDFR